MPGALPAMIDSWPRKNVVVLEVELEAADVVHGGERVGHVGLSMKPKLSTTW